MKRNSGSKKRVAVIGASIGGLVAAAELNQQGFSVTIFERSRNIGGLYSRTKTPFGKRELGMHVIYATDAHFKHLGDIFGREVFTLLEGHKVDRGGSASSGKVYFNSHYPDARDHRDALLIHSQVIASKGKQVESRNSFEEVFNRFGPSACNEIFVPILEKLWFTPAQELTRQAIHCFFDLRRMIICDKDEADILKANPWLDGVVGNPVQDRPHGKVFDGRLGLIFNDDCENLEERVLSWAEREGISIKLEHITELDGDTLLAGGLPLHEKYDACIAAIPIHSLHCQETAQLKKVELSIYYFELERNLKDAFPTYYILCHDPNLKSSRIVHYDAYRPRNPDDNRTIIAVEAIHPPGYAPGMLEIQNEISGLVPEMKIQSGFQLPRSLPVIIPSIENKTLLDTLKDRIKRNFGDCPIYFTGMRTDSGVFFSHHTIGLAYESALDCCKRLL